MQRKNSSAYRQWLAPVVCLSTALACGDTSQYSADARGHVSDAEEDFDAPGSSADGPPTGHALQVAGLCSDPACQIVQPGVLPYRPQFELYTDGATKRRWIRLPPGGQVDTSDMDNWRFPEGTMFWKEFSRDGVRTETRQLRKTGPGDNEWAYATFVWNTAQDSPTEVTSGLADVLGTNHDIPTPLQCRSCHEGTQTRVLGFSAIQLDVVGQGEALDLDRLIDLQLLTVNPVGATPRFAVPGSAVTSAALGYLHANCGHCHNPDSAVHDIRPLELRLMTGELGGQFATDTYTTTVNRAGATFEGATLLISPGDPDGSIVIRRMSTQLVALRMPRLGVEVPDLQGISLLRDWILQIPSE